VPNPDDDRFEAYLKQFRPLVPDALPISERELAFPRYWALGIGVAGAAVVIILGMVTFRIFHSQVPERAMNPQSVSVNALMQPLTMRDANALLATAPSYKAALDSMVFHPQRSTVPKDKQSALALLAKEKIKL
jgi:hypothetical protein